jgi:hypothetical protein
LLGTIQASGGFLSQRKVATLASDFLNVLDEFRKLNDVVMTWD